MPRIPIITGLDLGSSSTKVLIAQKRAGESKLQVLGQGQASSQGMRRGEVVAPKKAQKSIFASLEEAEAAFGRKAESIFVNVGGNRIFVASSHGLISVSRADRKISQEDIERVIQAAQTFPLPSNREILDVFPKEFVVDGEGGLKEPLGMEGVRLEVEALILCGFSPHLEKLEEAVSGAGLEIEGLALNPLASARAVLTPRDRELGVALLDIGAGTTGLAVFEEESPLHLAIFPIGSANITNDIAKVLRWDIDLADRIKIGFGSCVFEGKDKKESQQVGEETVNFSQKRLVEIIEARASEIFDLAQEELKKIGRSGELPAGVVLTGGGAKLPGMVDLAKKRLKLPCRIGVPKELYPLRKDPALATVAGLVLTGSDLVSAKERKLGGVLKRLFRAFIP